MKRSEIFMLLTILSVGALVTWWMWGNAVVDWHTYVFAHRDANGLWVNGYTHQPPVWWHLGIGGWATLSFVLFFFACVIKDRGK